MRKSLALFLILFCFNSYIAQNQSETSILTVGKIETIYSNELKENRTLNIFLPVNFDSTKIYPVIYVLDGSLNEDVVHIYGLSQFFPLYYDMPECIVVGIQNVDRRRDFTFPTENKELLEKNPTAGKSDQFINFIEKELVPFIQKNYSTSKTSFLIGQSLGGLLATQILVSKPQLFSHYLIVSPSLWWDNESLLKKIESKDFKCTIPDSTYVYVSVGKKEPKMMLTGAKRLYKVIHSIKNVKSDYKLMTEEDHATILHNSIYQALLKLYKPLY
jgi:predicted alpha/beta superfamily hydrolase